VSTVAELAFEEQFAALEHITKARPHQWRLQRLPGLRFRLDIMAKDKNWYQLLAECEDFPVTPPAWHWYDSTEDIVDQPKDTPVGSGFLHSSGRICAPWNRLAYQSCDPKGPHNDWQLHNWMTNVHTKGCITLSAMALRLTVELQSERYNGRN
jgi:hypothetical protein